MLLSPRLTPWVFGLVALAVFEIGWHGRSRPPELPAFRTPVVDTRPAEEPQITADDSDVRQPERPVPPPRVEAPPPPPVKEAPPPPKVEKPVEAPKASGPSVIGTWQVTEMSANGQTVPVGNQMRITFTFKEGGVVTGVHEMPSSGVRQEKEGTYEIAGDQITIRMDQNAQTMTFAFEGNDRLIFTFQQIRMVLTRS